MCVTHILLEIITVNAARAAHPDQFRERERERETFKKRNKKVSVTFDSVSLLTVICVEMEAEVLAYLPHVCTAISVISRESQRLLATERTRRYYDIRGQLSPF